MSGKRVANGTPTVRRWYRLPADMVAWLEEQSIGRDVSENLLVVRAIELLRENLPPLPSASPAAAETLEQATAALDAHDAGTLNL